MRYEFQMKHVTWVGIHLLRYFFVLVSVCMCWPVIRVLLVYPSRISGSYLYSSRCSAYFSIMTTSLNLVIELHQMSSPNTASQFLEYLLASSSKASEALDDVNSVATYWYKSIKAIMKSQGIIWRPFIIWLRYMLPAWVILVFDQNTSRLYRLDAVFLGKQGGSKWGHVNTVPTVSFCDLTVLRVESLFCRTNHWYEYGYIDILVTVYVIRLKVSYS